MRNFTASFIYPWFSKTCLKYVGKSAGIGILLALHLSATVKAASPIKQNATYWILNSVLHLKEEGRLILNYFLGGGCFINLITLQVVKLQPIEHSCTRG